MDFKNVFSKNKSAKLYVTIGLSLLGILIICFLIFRICSTFSEINNTDEPYGKYEITDGRQKQVISDGSESDAGYIKFAGYGKYEVSEESPSIELSNPSSNFTDFVFVVRDSETQELIGKTEKVSPGKFVYMNVMDFYKTPGLYNVDINVSTYDSVTNAQLNGVNQKMEIIVR